MGTANRDDTFGYTPAIKEGVGGFQCDKKMNNVNKEGIILKDKEKSKQ